MAARIEMEHLIRCDVDAFWTNFLDSEAHRTIFTFELGYPSYRVTDSTDQGGAVHRRVEITPKLNMPHAVQKIIGERFSYVELGELDRGVYRFKLLPPPAFRADRATAEGSMRAEATREGFTRRVVELNIDIRMLGLGSMLESFASKAAQDAYAAHASAVNALLAAAPVRT